MLSKTDMWHVSTWHSCYYTCDTYVANGCNNTLSHTTFIVKTLHFYLFSIRVFLKFLIMISLWSAIENKIVFLTDNLMMDVFVILMWNWSVVVNYQGGCVSRMPRTRLASLMVLMWWMLLGSLYLLSWLSLLLTLILVFAGTFMMCGTSVMLVSTWTVLAMMNSCSWTAVTNLHLPLFGCHQRYVSMPNTDLSL